MGTVIIPEQDIINAICIFMSHEKDVEPNEVDVELIYDDEAENAFSAETFVNRQQQILPSGKMIAALRLWIDLYLGMDAIAAGIQLDFNESEGIFATVR